MRRVLVALAAVAVLVTLTSAAAGRATRVVTQDTATAGGKVVRVQTEVGRTATRTTALLAARSTGRPLARTLLAARRTRRLPRVDVVLSTRGDVAAIVGDRVVVAAVGRRRLVRRASELSNLALEDDRTVTWRTAGRLRLADLPATRTPGRCPAREGFETVAKTPQIRVTQRDYETSLDGPIATVVRACEPARGTDRVVGLASTHLDGRDILSAVGADRDWVVMAGATSTDKDGMCRRRVVTARARGGRVRRFPAGNMNCIDPGAVPRSGEPIVVSASGRPAWIAQRPTGQRVVTFAAESGFRELEPWTAAPITDLRYEGGQVFWTCDGVERSATL